MLQELAAGSGTSAWAVGSMLFFLAVYVAVMVRAARTRTDELDRRARLALDDNQEQV
jgi:cbb3-type cytochrome oxidase subunit 3